MNKREMNTIGAGAVALLCLLSAGPADAADVAIGTKGGTLGLGVELTMGLGQQWNTRLSVNGFDYSHRGEASDIEYDAELRLRSATALLDFHPGGRGFRLTAGAVWNGTKVEGSSLRPASGVYDIGGVPVPADILGTLATEVNFDPIVPYVGLGWGNAVGANKKVGFSFELGALFQGSADVELISVNANPPILAETLQALLDREARELEDEVADYDIYPVVSFGVTYRF